MILIAKWKRTRKYHQNSLFTILHQNLTSTLWFAKFLKVLNWNNSTASWTRDSKLTQVLYFNVTSSWIALILDFIGVHLLFLGGGIYDLFYRHQDVNKLLESVFMFKGDIEGLFSSKWRYSQPILILLKCIFDLINYLTAAFAILYMTQQNSQFWPNTVMYLTSRLILVLL